MTKAKHGTRIADRSLVRIDRDGIVKRTTTEVELRADRKHFYLSYAGRNQSKAKIITADGFFHLAKHAPLAWIPVETLVNDGGQTVGNPEDRRRQDGFVRVRRFAVGRTADGTLRAYDLTLRYDLRAYFTSDILRKFEDDRNGKNKWGEIINSRAIDRFLEEHPGWGEVEIGPDIRLAFNASNPDVRRLYSEYSERMRFADRFASTVAERNILKRHFGISALPQDSNKVVVHCWHSADFDFEDLAKKVVTRNGRVMVDGQEIAVQVEDEVASVEDERAAAQSEADAGEASTLHEQDDPGVEPMPADILPKIREALAQVGKAKSEARKEVEAKMLEMLEPAGITSLKDLSGCQDVVLLQSIHNEIVSSQR